VLSISTAGDLVDDAITVSSSCLEGNLGIINSGQGKGSSVNQTCLRASDAEILYMKKQKKEEDDITIIENYNNNRLTCFGSG
jgi:hypothetical protein